MPSPFMPSPVTRLLRFAPALTALAIASGCASLNSVSHSQVPQDRSMPIESQGSSWGILGITFSNSFVDEAIEGLRSRCPNGKISGVYTKYEGRFYWLWTTRTITAKAFCEKKKAG